LLLEGLFVWEVETVPKLADLPPRPQESNKGDFGRILIVAGSRGMSGAAVLCGGATLRGGAGLVYVAVPESVQPVIAAANPCYLTHCLPQDDHGQLSPPALPELKKMLQGQHVIAAGSGLGQSAAISSAVAMLLGDVQVPLVLDADGLNAVGQNTLLFKGRKAPLIITPHPGEFARLIGSDPAAVQAQRQASAVRF